MIGERRTCNCIKADVCNYYGNIMSAFSGIIEMRFGGRDPAYDKLTKLIEKECKYREQNKKRRKRQADKMAKQFQNIKTVDVNEFKLSLNKKKKNV